MKSRLHRLRQEMTRRELDAVLISQPENRFYLSGFNGSAGYLLITGESAALATDFRYTEQAERQAPDYSILQISGAISTWLPELVARLDSARLGFEAGHVSFATHAQLAETLAKIKPGLTLVPEQGLAESLRAVKEPTEVELISRAVEMADRAFDEVADSIRPGITERGIAWELERLMRESGSQALPFDIIVASGPNAALPHHKPSDRMIEAGEPIIIDMGARVEGYCSDLSRTLCLGAPDDTFRLVYNTVLEAQSAAIEGIKEGMSGHEADSLAREVISRAGYGEAFGHALGHGVGLAEHEEPRLGPNSAGVLETDMVFSIEPGVYLTGWGGVRIEDLAVMASGRVKLLSKAEKLDMTGSEGGR